MSEHIRCGDDIALEGADPDCVFCGGDGLDPVRFFIGGECAPCPCMAATSPPPVIDLVDPDADDDGWLDGVAIVRAKYIRAKLVPEPTAIVMHRLHRGYHSAGPRYVQNPRAKGKPRYVSWHLTVHRPGWERMITQHAPITHRCYHAGKANGYSIGIEHDWPGHDGYGAKQLDESVRLVEQLMLAMPPLAKIIAHRYLYPKTRSDPGFSDAQWARYEALGLRVYA